MKRLSLLFALSITVALHAQLDDSTRAAIDKLFAPYDSTDAPGAAAGIIQNGELVFAEGYGLANLETGEPATPETNFRLASVTKQFTAACVLQLVEAGEATLETTLGSLFPEFPDYADDITVEHMLEHTSGLADYESLYPDTQTVQLHDADVVRLVAAVDSTLFPPGSRHQYSNSGYAVLATIVEKLSGVSFAEYLQANVFAPLGMDATVAYEKGVSEVERRAYGYSRADDGWERTDQNVTSAVLGDGGIYSSVVDLAKWDAARYDDRILPRSVMDEATTRQTTNEGETFDYGFGWRLSTLDGDEVEYHTGASIGFRTILYRVPSRKTTVAILTNRNEGETLALAEAVMRSLPR
ncbi:MAG: serine hydrolase [Ignavibacteriales bacterium]|nr:serine hydrolase [Ignavibacteriales bacterium]